MPHTLLARIGRTGLSLFMRQPNRDCITNDNRKVTFPSHLPDEIIIEIIQMTFEECSGDLSPIRYIRVCKNWQRVITTTPCLWTHLSLSIRFEKRGRNTKIVESAIKTWLRHSGANPISFSFEASWSETSLFQNEGMGEIWDAFGDALDKLIPRCRELTISSATNYYLPERLRTQLEHAPHLRSLRLYGWVCRCRDWLPVILRMLPQLRECTSVIGTFSGAAINDSRVSNMIRNIPLNAPNETLRHLHLTHYTTNAGLRLILTHFPSLEYVKIKYAPIELITTRSQSTASLESPIVLSRLSKLDITFSICRSSWLLPVTAITPLEASRYEAFHHFRFPSLTELTIDSETRTRLLTHSEDLPCVQCFDAVINGLANSIRCSDAKVSLLSLTVENESFGAFQQLFPVLPDVKVLRCNIRREEYKVRLRAGITSCVDELALFIDALQDGNRASPMMFFAKLESLDIYDSRRVLQSARASSEMLAHFVRVRRIGIRSFTEPGAGGQVVEGTHDFPSSSRDASSSGTTSSVDVDKDEILNTHCNHNETYSLQRLKVTEYREESEGTGETQRDKFFSLQLLKNSAFMEIIKDGLIFEYEGSYDHCSRTR